MSTTKPIRYYLCNGETGKANAINFKVDGELKRDFIDIAELDLQTMDIKYDKARSILQEFNEDIDLNGKFFDTQFPFKEVEKKTSPVIFECEDKELIKHFDTLRHLAELRTYKKNHNHSVKLEDNRELQDFYRGILYRIMKTEDKYFYQRERTYSIDLKEQFANKITAWKFEDPNKYISHMLYSDKLKGTLQNYTQLRLLLLELSNYLNNKEYYINRNHQTTYDTYSIERLKPIDNQISIFDILKENEKKLEKK